MYRSQPISRRQLVKAGVALTTAVIASAPMLPSSLVRSSSAGGRGIAIGDTVYVDVYALNLRTGQSLDHDVITVLQQGASGDIKSGPVWAEGYTWYRINVGQQGWVAGEYLSRFDQEPQGLVLIVTGGRLNVRSQPSLSGSILTSVPVGTTLRVLQADGGIWADGYHWIFIRVLAQNLIDGFVADAFTAHYEG